MRGKVETDIVLNAFCPQWQIGLGDTLCYRFVSEEDDSVRGSIQVSHTYKFPQKRCNKKIRIRITRSATLASAPCTPSPTPTASAWPPPTSAATATVRAGPTHATLTQTGKRRERIRLSICTKSVWERRVNSVFSPSHNCHTHPYPERVKATFPSQSSLAQPHLFYLGEVLAGYTHAQHSQGLTHLLPPSQNPSPTCCSFHIRGNLSRI